VANESSSDNPDLLSLRQSVARQNLLNMGVDPRRAAQRLEDEPAGGQVGIALQVAHVDPAEERADVVVGRVFDEPPVDGIRDAAQGRRVGLEIGEELIKKHREQGGK